MILVQGKSKKHIQKTIHKTRQTQIRGKEEVEMESLAAGNLRNERVNTLLSSFKPSLPVCAGGYCFGIKLEMLFVCQCRSCHF
jgi:hypothetical protein